MKTEKWRHKQRLVQRKRDIGSRGYENSKIETLAKMGTKKEWQKNTSRGIDIGRCDEYRKREMTQTGRKRERDCLGGPHPLQDEGVGFTFVHLLLGRQAGASEPNIWV